MSVLVILILIYGSYHFGHSQAKWRHYRNHRFTIRLFLSVPGPWGSRVGISKRL